MTASVDDYTSLITSEHDDQPNFLATISAIVQPLVENQNLLAAMPELYDLDVAVGAQLDVVGQWVGLSRNLQTPIAGVYFSFDTAGLGFDEGVWYSSSDPAEGVISLDDSTYRLMIHGKIIANIWDGTLGEANRLLLTVFPGTDVQMQDNFDMTETLVVSGSPPSLLFAELVNQGYIQLRPAAVELV